MKLLVYIEYLSATFINLMLILHSKSSDVQGALEGDFWFSGEAKWNKSRVPIKSAPSAIKGVADSKIISLLVTPLFDRATFYVDGKRKDAAPFTDEPPCFFQGHEIGNPSHSFLSLSTCNKNSTWGHLKLNETEYFLEPNSAHPTAQPENWKKLVFTRPKSTSIKGISRTRRQASSWLDVPSVKPLKQQDYFRLLSQVTETFLFNRKTISLSVYVDKDLASDFRTESDLKKYLFALINIVDGIFFKDLYRTHVVLNEVKVWSAVNLVDLSADVEKNLRNFLMHLETLPQMPPSTVTLLLTGKKLVVPFESASNYRSICDPKKSAGVIRIFPDKMTDQSETPNTVALVLGNILGLTHDGSTACNCSEGCIMSKFSPYVLSKFSRCSKNEYLQLVTSGRGFCLFDSISKSMDGGVNHNHQQRLGLCGNGLMDPGEECDCGTQLECALTGHSSCCSQCMLTASAQCGSGECCNSQCRLRSNGSVCREQMGQCDVEERCDGHSPLCPPNTYKIDASPCNHQQDFCLKGECLTKDQQCQLLYGIQSKSGVDLCYHNLNSAGSGYGNCGDLGGGNYRPCYRQNVYCGMLQCNGSLSTSVRIEKVRRFRFNPFNTNSHSSQQGINDKCSSASVVLDDGTDVGYVAPGTKCGTNRVCSRDSQCLDLRASDMDYFVCPGHDRITGHFCSHHGFCSNQRLCVCDYGWKGSDCSIPDERFIRDHQIPKDDPSTPADKLMLGGTDGEWTDWQTYHVDRDTQKHDLRNTKGDEDPGNFNGGVKVEIAEFGTPVSRPSIAPGFKSALQSLLTTILITNFLF
ncbi:disintegrin and metalloproteinase domain-containing protein 11-like isoform X2 [Symsagittifera roscoffensis]|uniref:disintegrin and metalloproteinase domain-containing protein 11-like isoform X2 n=1 Tax=Symsagittifera roscoffensis TaxID=84072 RepID=UPI00307B7019